MNCLRCKNVKLIRLEFSPMNLRAPGERMRPPVDRCPCCGLEWPVTASKPQSESVAVSKPIDPQPEQLMLFSPTVGGLQ